MHDNDVLAALDAFERAGVEAVLVGGAAINLYGSAYTTLDIDFCCSRTNENLERLSRALSALHPRFRVQGVLEGVPVRLDAEALRAGEAFSFITDLGNLDVRFNVDGIGGYAEVLAMSHIVKFGERSILMLSITGLIQSKRFMARPRDWLVLPELEMMREAQFVHEHGAIEPDEDRPPDS